MTTLVDLRRSRHLADGITSADFSRLRETVGGMLENAMPSKSADYWRGQIDAALRQPFALEQSAEYQNGWEQGRTAVKVNGCSAYVDGYVCGWKRRNARWVKGIGLVYAR